MPRVFTGSGFRHCFCAIVDIGDHDDDDDDAFFPASEGFTSPLHQYLSVQQCKPSRQPLTLLLLFLPSILGRLICVACMSSER